MAKKVPVHEIEALVWMRGKIPARTAEAASDKLLDMIRVQEGRLDKISGNDYDISMVARFDGRPVDAGDLVSLRVPLMSAIRRE